MIMKVNQKIISSNPCQVLTPLKIIKTQRPFRFLNLPTELRLHIYEIGFASLAFDASEQETIYCTALLCTSRERAEMVFLFLT